jgi:hypothetical protein
VKVLQFVEFAQDILELKVEYLLRIVAQFVMVDIFFDTLIVFVLLIQLVFELVAVDLMH